MSDLDVLAKSLREMAKAGTIDGYVKMGCETALSVATKLDRAVRIERWARRLLDVLPGTERTDGSWLPGIGFQVLGGHFARIKTAASKLLKALRS